MSVIYWSTVGRISVMCGNRSSVLIRQTSPVAMTTSVIAIMLRGRGGGEGGRNLLCGTITP